MTQRPSPPALAAALLPWLFVLLWSTGFIGAKFGLPYVEPLTFLTLRYAIVLVLMAAVALVLRAPWPRSARQWLHIGVSGLFVHGVYLAGPEGLAKGKKVIVASTRGGVYSTSEMGQALEHQESYLKTVFGFLGITDVSIVRAEGVAMGDESKAKALESARNDIVRAAAAANQEAAIAA